MAHRASMKFEYGMFEFHGELFKRWHLQRAG
jgi:hypothetical protein